MERGIQNKESVVSSGSTLKADPHGRATAVALPGWDGEVGSSSCLLASASSIAPTYMKASSGRWSHLPSQSSSKGGWCLRASSRCRGSR